MNPDAPYIVGIDLGTTNTVVAYTESRKQEGSSPTIHIFDIPQRVSVDSIEKRGLLPSFLLVPGAQEVANDGQPLNWDANRRCEVGEYARDRGAELPAQLIFSAKSWLCSPGVDRQAPILPWQGADADVKLSPLEASAAILAHIRSAWNQEMGGEGEQYHLENQNVLLTVPASFDTVARDFTVRAAELAGLPQVTLLEEPQAAFYAWLATTGDQWREQVAVDDHILVVDIGGGTCDFSLIRVIDADGELALERVAVGEHLLVGGDNMDLALAHSVAQRLSAKGTRLDAWQMRGLWQSCRFAKEHLLNTDADEPYPISILGRGSQLIGGTLRTEVNRHEIERIVLNGFFPKCEPDEAPQRGSGTGIREIGLAYEADPAISRHLAAFLSRQQDITDESGLAPSAVLFNGGVMKPAAMQRRVIDLLNQWRNGIGAEPIRRIAGIHLDRAVAQGAVYYGLARSGSGIRIRSGLGQSYYLGIAASLPAVPGMPAPMKALCVAPFGMEEGTVIHLPEKEFHLTVGVPVSFDFLSASSRPDDSAGLMVEDWEAMMEKIATLDATLDGAPGTGVPVTLEVHLTETGTLELWCVAKNDTGRWKLELNTRSGERQ